MHRIVIIILFLSFSIYSKGQTSNLSSDPKQAWIDSVYQSLSLEEQIGQVFMIRAHSNETEEFNQEVEDAIVNYKVGGLCFFQGGPGRQIDLINRYQAKSDVPLFIAIDGEWGISMRLDSVEQFPRQMTLGAIQDDSLIYLMGSEIARQANLAGIHINFAPVVDVNNNPNNPVINSRSFGDNTHLVSMKSNAYMLGMQNGGVMACAKHFPGHGDTDRDSHKTLPTISADSATIDKIHLAPFKHLIDQGIGSIMVAHLHVPALHTQKGSATTLSRDVVTDLLKNQLGYKGLVITDALEMKGVSNYHEAGKLELKALQAGNDILLLPTDIGLAIKEIKAALADGTLDSTELEIKIKKILAAKYEYKLNKASSLSKDNLFESINTEHSKALIQNLYNASITVVHNDDALPLKTDMRIKYAVVNIGGKADNEFVQEAEKYHQMDVFTLSVEKNLTTGLALLDTLKNYDYIIVNIQGTYYSAKRKYNIKQSTYQLLDKYSEAFNVIVNIYANPYSLLNFDSLLKIKAITVAYQDNMYSQRAVANALFGGIKIDGKIPFSSSKRFPTGSGINIEKSRIGFVGSWQLELNSTSFDNIDQQAIKGIEVGAYPGCQIMIIKDGQVVYQKSFGTQTYKKSEDVNNYNIYDLASVTKILATTVSVMKLYDNKQISIDTTIGYYLKDARGSNKENLYLRDILSHRAQLKPWIPFYYQTMNNKVLDTNLYSHTFSTEYNKQVANKLYIKGSYKKEMLSKIYSSDLLPQKSYKYSDLGMYLLKEIVEQESKLSLDQFTTTHFYAPLGMQYTSFNPLHKFDLKDIIPTEKDDIYRKQVVRGYVHDQGAAMLGGVSGHAGLFSNTQDIAIMMQMLLQNGSYGGERYIDSTTVSYFTQRHFQKYGNRRGLGFDKPLINPSNGGPTCAYVSSSSYGHSGFTGTYVWADPEHQLIYIFLSNRTYPSSANRKLINLNIRTNIQAEIYKQFNLTK